MANERANQVVPQMLQWTMRPDGPASAPLCGAAQEGQRIAMKRPSDDALLAA
jgi:hypothetical protein